MPAMAKQAEPVYIEKPPINRPRTISIPDRNRLYAILNPQPEKISPELKEYIKSLKDVKEDD